MISLTVRYDGTDATNLIPPRLGVGAAAVGIMDAAGRINVQIYTLPHWEVMDSEPQPEEARWNQDELESLRELDSVHNPVLAELWRDDVNDSLVDNP